MQVEKTEHKKRRFYALISYLSGFSLIEIVVAIAILSTISAGLLIAVDPRRQQEKARDAVRISDIGEIRNALNVYYDDTKCFPLLTSAFKTALQNGTEWKEGTTVYMQKVPKDPIGAEYTYITDTVNSCPQWGTIFAKLSSQQSVDPQTNATAFCSLSGSDNRCVPQGFDSSWACVTSGNTNCSQVVASVLTSPTPSVPTPTPTTTPTPPLEDGSFTVALNANPQFYQGTLSPLYPPQNSQAQISIKVADPNPVTAVTATVYTDIKTNNVTFALTSGTATDGTWTGSWTVNDTLDNFYKITFFGTDSADNHSSVDVVLR